MGQGQRPGRARRNIRHCFGGHVAFGGLGLPIGITLAASEAKLGPLVQLVSKQNRRRNKVKRQRHFGTEVEAASTAANHCHFASAAFKDTVANLYRHRLGAGATTACMNYSVEMF